MLDNLSVRAKLALLGGLMLACLIVSGALSVWLLARTVAGTQAMHADRIVPLQQLKSVADLYAVNIVDAAHKVRDGGFTLEQGRASVADAIAGIRRDWTAYGEGVALARERELVQGMAPLLAQADAAVVRLQALLTAGDAEGLRDYAAREMYPALDPLQGKLAALIQLQIDVAAELRDDAEAQFRLAAGGVAVFVAVALFAGGGLAWRISDGVSRPLAGALAGVEGFADGDLGAALPAAGRDEIGRLVSGLGRMRAKLAETLDRVRLAADQVAAASGQIAQGNDDLARRTERQGASLQQTASALAQLTSTVAQTADNARSADTLARQACAVAETGGQAVGEVVQTMTQIADSSRQVREISTVIDGIAFQTNILALNAAVEAARAGEAGRGFAVVAAEVRTLAQRSASAAREIRGLIENTVNRIESGSRVALEAGQTMQTVVGAVREVSVTIGEISAATGEQRAGIAELDAAVSTLDSSTQQNAALVKEANAATASMHAQARHLVSAVSVFRH